MGEKRRYRRVVNAPDMPMETACCWDGNGKLRLLKIVDISMGGAKLSFPDSYRLTINKTITIGFLLDKDTPEEFMNQTPLKLEVEVRWTSPNFKDHSKQWVGVEFKEIPGELKKKIEYLLTLV